MNFPPPPGRGVYTQAEIARLFSCADGHVKNLITAGELGAVDLRSARSSRNSYRIIASELSWFIESRSIGFRSDAKARNQRCRPSAIAFTKAYSNNKKEGLAYLAMWGSALRPPI